MNARALTLTLMLVLSTFSTVFVPQPTAVLTETNEPLLAGNTTDCGTNASNVSFEVEAYQPVWNRHDTVSAFLDTYCGVWWKTYRVNWLLVSQDNSSLIDSGQSTFITNNSSVTYHPNHTDHFNEVDVHFPYMETGNYSISGDFYVLDNTTWTWLANVSNTFQVNGTNTTTACGYNDTLVSMETDVSSNFYYEGASVYAWSDIECPVLGTPYGYSWEIYDQNSSAVFQSGSTNFTATWQNVHLFTDGSGIYHDINLAFHNLTDGVYTLSTMLNAGNGSYVDSANLTFQVWANNSGGGNQTNTGCGYNASSFSLSSWYSPSPVYDGDTLNATVYTNCNLLNTTMSLWYGISNSTTWLASGNWTYTATSLSDMHHIEVANVPAGTYELTVDAYYGSNYTSLMSYNTTITVLANNSGGGNQTNTGCGYDVNYTMLMAYTAVQMYEGDEFVSWISTYCDLINTSMWIHAYIYDESQSVVANTSMFWTPTASTGISDNWNVTGLVAGNYTFTATLYAYPGSSVTVETDTVSFTVYPVTNNSGCGYDSNYTAVYAYSWQSIFNVGNMFESTVNSYCNLLGSTTMIEWTVYYPSNWTIVAQGNTSWYVNSTSDSLTVNHAAFDAGNYAFLAKLSVWDNNGPGWNFITDSVYNFSYVASNGNVSSGQLDIDTNANNFFTGDTIEVAYESTELIIGETYNLAWSVYDENQIVVDSGNWSWLAYTNTSLEWLNYTVDGAPISAGGYCFVGILYHVDANYSTTWIAQDDTCVHVYTNSTGGGGNQTNTGCGYWANATTMTATVAGYPSEGDDLGVMVNLQCLVLGATGELNHNLWYTSPTGTLSFVDMGSQSWNITTTTDSFYFEWDNVMNGTYTLELFLNYTTANSSVYVTHTTLSLTVPSQDSDLDGISDMNDNCPYNANPNQEDLDNDGVGDECDPDGDGDGVNNSMDDFPADPTEWMDSDNDGVGDNADNCPNVANTDQSDADNNSIGDACDTNSGGNGNNTNTNTPPVIAGVTISPNMPQSDDNLTCMYTTFDADGDSVTTTVVWKVNGNTIASGTDTLSIGYAVGDEVQCVVSGSDGQAPGNTDSDTVTILPSVSDVDDGTGNGLPALGSVGTLLAIAIGVSLTRRDEE